VHSSIEKGVIIIELVDIVSELIAELCERAILKELISDGLDDNLINDAIANEMLEAALSE
jgi:uncharacterized hydantoinase/oxoprolinase family protein